MAVERTEETRRFRDTIYRLADLLSRDEHFSHGETLHTALGRDISPELVAETLKVFEHRSLLLEIESGDRIGRGFKDYWRDLSAVCILDQCDEGWSCDPQQFARAEQVSQENGLFRVCGEIHDYGDGSEFLATVRDATVRAAPLDGFYEEGVIHGWAGASRLGEFCR